MPTILKTRIVKIGNSQGIRIPKLLLQQSNLGKEIELELRAGQIILRPSYQTRQNWEKQFQAMADLGDDQLLDSNILSPTTWEAEEWEW